MPWGRRGVPSGVLAVMQLRCEHRKENEERGRVSLPRRKQSSSAARSPSTSTLPPPILHRSNGPTGSRIIPPVHCPPRPLVRPPQPAYSPTHLSLQRGRGRGGPAAGPVRRGQHAAHQGHRGCAQLLRRGRASAAAALVRRLRRRLVICCHEGAADAGRELTIGDGHRGRGRAARHAAAAALAACPANAAAGNVGRGPRRRQRVHGKAVLLARRQMLAEEAL